MANRLHIFKRDYVFWLKIIEVFSQDPIDNKSTLVQVMSWCQIGNKPLPELMLTEIYNARGCNMATMSELIGPWEISI